MGKRLVLFLVLLLAVTSGRAADVRRLDAYSGDLGRKINSALAECPTAGCILDGRFLPSSTAFITPLSIDRPVVILFGHTTIFASTQFSWTQNNVHIICAGFERSLTASGTTFQFTEATHGFRVGDGVVSNISGGSIRDCSIRTSNPAGLSAIRLEGGPGGATVYFQIDNVHIEPNASSLWNRGIELINAQNIYVTGGIIFGGGNGITTAVYGDGLSRGNTFSGVSITGRPASGTERGVFADGSAGSGGYAFRWLGGVIQGGFTTAAIDVNNMGASIHGLHLEVTSGGGDAIRYDNSGLGMHIDGGNYGGGQINIGPTAVAWDFSIHGSATQNINVNAFARNATICPMQVNNTITVNPSATHTLICSTRRVGQSVRDAMQLEAVTFSQLGTPANGSIRYCSDCTIANPCAAGGTGAIAKRLNAIWVCN